MTVDLRPLLWDRREWYPEVFCKTETRNQLRSRYFTRPPPGTTGGSIPKILIGNLYCRYFRLCHEMGTFTSQFPPPYNDSRTGDSGSGSKIPFVSLFTGREIRYLQSNPFGTQGTRSFLRVRFYRKRCRYNLLPKKVYQWSIYLPGSC